jgi:hypothetical protein
MKKVVLIILSLFIIIACNRNKTILTKGEWMQEWLNQYGNSEIDTFRIKTRIKFNKNGFIYENKYSLNGKYIVKGNKIKFVSIVNDTIFLTWNITNANKNMVLLETTQIKKNINGTDSIIKLKMVYKKIEPLPDKPYDKVLYNLGSLYNIGSGELIGGSQIFYTFNCMKGDNYFEYDDSYSVEPKIKGTIDRSIGSLPKEEKLEKYSSWENSIMNEYTWETLDYKLLLEDYYKNTYDDKNYLEVKIWITEK